MSHFTAIETKINDLVCLKAALEDLGLVYEEATESQLVKVRGWRGAMNEAEMCIHMTSQYDVGVRRNADGTYGLVADWWAIEEELNEKQEQIQQKIIRRYAYHKAKTEAAKQGFTLDEESVSDDGTIKLVVSREAPTNVQISTGTTIKVGR